MDKIIELSVLLMWILPKGGLFLLNAPEGRVHIIIVKGPSEEIEEDFLHSARSDGPGAFSRWVRRFILWLRTRKLTTFRINPIPMILVILTTTHGRQGYQV